MIRVWDRAGREPVRVITGHRANIQSISVDQNYLYPISTDKTAFVWDKHTGGVVWEYRKLFDKGMLGISSTDTHLLLLNLTRGLKAVPKGRWDSEMMARPEIRSTKTVFDGERCYFGLADGRILVLRWSAVGF